MDWFGREESSNVEDRRGRGGSFMRIGGVGGIVIALLAWYFGVDLSQLTGPTVNENQPSHERSARTNPAEDRLASFTKVVLRDTEIVWTAEFNRLGKKYRPPTLVLFTDAVSSACGMAQSATGPFYCPADEKVYIDLSFYHDMDKLDAPGDLARAYVIAHEVGHHVQRLLGFAVASDKRRSASVPRELQADYLAGVWAHDAQEKFRYLDANDVPSALNAAFQIGDDRLQRRSRGYVVPDSFTHGTSAQRRQAFRRGNETGDVMAADRIYAGPNQWSE